MTEKYTFKYDKTGRHWEDDAKFRSMFCRHCEMVLRIRYEEMGYLHLTDIYEYFGIKCPREHIEITFIKDNILDINCEMFNDFVLVTCVYVIK